MRTQLQQLPAASMPAPSNAPTIDKRRLMRDLNAIGRIGIAATTVQ